MFKSSRNAIVDFLREEDGPTAVEYAVMLAVITMGIVGSVTLMAEATRDSFLSSGDAIAGAFAN